MKYDKNFIGPPLPPGHDTEGWEKASELYNERQGDWIPFNEYESIQHA